MSAPAQPSRLLFAFLGAATFFEGYDFIALTQVLPDVRATFGLTEAQGGWLVGVGNIGPVLAFALVRMADRLGRARVLTWTIAGYTLASIASGLAPNAWVFGASQLVARAFLIAEWAVCLVYAAEVYPAERRGAAIGTLQALAAVGAVVCAGLTPVLLKTAFGWRTVYFVGALPLALLAIARRSLQESPRFAAPAAAAPLLSILQGPYRRRILHLALLWFLTYAGTHVALAFWKEYAVHEARFTDGEVGRTLAIASVIALPLVFVTARLLDSLGRRKVAMGVFPATALGAWGAYTFTDPVGLTVSMTLLVYGCSAVLPVLEALNAELFPTAQRGDAFGWSNNLLGRQAAVWIPPVAGTLAGTWGWGPVVRLTAIPVVLALVGILAWMPETRKRELEDTAAV